MTRPLRLPLTWALLALAAAPATGAAAQIPAAYAPAAGAELGDDYDLQELSIEELLQIEVTIATKSSQKLSEIPAAVYVLTGDEIRRSGHSSIPEALRMVPGFYVSRWTGDAWDVTSRGFGPGLSLTNSAYLNQLLVLIDGVVVYSPLFAGTWWPLQDVDLADVERIEILRGPGGSLWGANAVHGVVHIITKDPEDTQGPQLALRAGLDDRHGSARYGGTFGENGRYRVWAKLADYDTPHSPFLNFDQDWNLNSAGFRTEWSSDGKDFTVWTRAFEGRFDDTAFDLTFFFPFEDVADKKGFQGYWSMEDPESDSKLQAWLTTEQQAIPTLVDMSFETLDLEYQRRFHFEDTQLTLGTGVRRTHSEVRGDDPFFLDFTPQEFTNDVFRVYGLSRTALSDTVELLLGLTVEHNDFTQFEIQPTARATYAPSEDTMAWVAISRAVRTPSLEENFLSAGSAFVGTTDFVSEVLWSYEAGVRHLFSEDVSADLALFYNDYDDLHFAELDPFTFQSILNNDAEGTGYGAELAVDVRPADWWSLRSAYSFLAGDYEADGVDIGTEDQSPEHQFNLRSYVDLGENWELDTAVYVVEDLGDFLRQAEYVRADARLGWTPSDSLELYVGIQGLTESTRSEFDEFDNARRAGYAGLVWKP